MVKYDLMLAEWASGSITNRFPIEFWVYKVISRKNSYGGYVGFIGYVGYKLVTISVTMTLHPVGGTSLQSFIDPKFDEESFGDTPGSPF